MAGHRILVVFRGAQIKTVEIVVNERSRFESQSPNHLQAVCKLDNLVSPVHASVHRGPACSGSMEAEDASGDLPELTTGSAPIGAPGLLGDNQEEPSSSRGDTISYRRRPG